ncbi:MAG: hypothetical protein RLZZ15_3258, partial [Verrucomicrobiota bacterium]
ERFRPVDLQTGPDGALYILDLYRGVLQHRISLTSYLRKQSEDRGLVAPIHLGRLYRVVPDGAPPPKFPRLDRATPAALVGELSERNSWRRETAQRLLVERGDTAVAPALREVVARGVSAFGRLHALCTLEGLGAADAATVAAALRDAEPFVRTAAIRIAEIFLARPAERAAFTEKLLALRADPSPEVQQQLVLTLGESGDLATELALAHFVRAQPANVFLADAFFSGLHRRELPLLDALAADPAWPANDETANRVLGGLAKGLANSRDPRAVARVLALAAASPPARATALLAGAASSTLATAARPVRLAAEPADFLALKKNPAAPVRAAAAKLDPLLAWPGKSGAPTEAVAAPLTAAERARFDAGRTLYLGICGACHQPHGHGLDGLAPPLADSEWVTGPASRTVRIALHGVRGPIKVLGRTYYLDMPPLGALSDEQVSAITTYIRREWGHTATPVAPEFVAAIRKEVGPRTEGWTQEELLKVP